MGASKTPQAEAQKPTAYENFYADCLVEEHRRLRAAEAVDAFWNDLTERERNAVTVIRAYAYGRTPNLYIEGVRGSDNRRLRKALARLAGGKADKYPRGDHFDVHGLMPLENATLFLETIDRGFEDEPVMVDITLTGDMPATCRVVHERVWVDTVDGHYESRPKVVCGKED